MLRRVFFLTLVAAATPFVEARSEEADDAPVDEPVLSRASLYVDSRLGFDTAHEGEGERVFGLELAAKLELEADLSKRVSVFAAPAFFYVAELDRETNDRESLYLHAPEGYVSLAFDPFTLRAGFLVFSWGTSDLVAPIDVLNPVDLRRSPASLDPVKIPVLGAELVAYFEPLSLRLVVEPLFTASRFALSGTDWSLLRSAQAFGLPALDLAPLLGEVSADRLSDELLVTDRPRARPDDATVGGRLTWSDGALELSASGVYGWDGLPKIVVDPDLMVVADALGDPSGGGLFSDPAVVAALLRLQEKQSKGEVLYRGSFERRAMLGIDGSYALEPFLLKLDAAYTFERTFYSQALSPLSLPWLTATVGLEYMEGEALLVSLEVFGMVAFDVPGGARLLFLEERCRSTACEAPEDGRTVIVPGFAALFRYTMLDGDLVFECLGLGTFGRSDAAFSPGMDYRVDDRHRLGVGAFLVAGRPDGYGGVYGRNDEVFVRYRFSY